MAMYGTVQGVYALAPTMGTPGTTTTPTLSQIEAWLATAYSITNRHLSSAGYSTPVAASADVYNELVGLSNLYASALVLRARGLDVVEGSSENRSKELMDEFYDRLEGLAASDLSQLGVSRSTVARRRRRVRTMQIRRVDGFSAAYEDNADEDTVSE